LRVAVADSWAILALLRGEGQAAGAMRRYLRRARAGNLEIHLNVVSLGEVFYRTMQVRDEDAALLALDRVEALPLSIVPARQPLVIEAARIKARHPLSYADAFVVATARILHAPVITGDPEILALPKTVVRVRGLVR
jgi:predicted nucleic acid-binding protein